MKLFLEWFAFVTCCVTAVLGPILLIATLLGKCAGDQ